MCLCVCVCVCVCVCARITYFLPMKRSFAKTYVHSITDNYFEGSHIYTKILLLDVKRICTKQCCHLSARYELCGMCWNNSTCSSIPYIQRLLILSSSDPVGDIARKWSRVKSLWNLFLCLPNARFAGVLYAFLVLATPVHSVLILTAVLTKLICINRQLHPK